jgi:hypothetical protein
MPPQRLGRSLRILSAFGLVFDPFVASMTGVAVDCFAGSTIDPVLASAISSSSALIAFRSRAIDRSLFSEKFRLTREPSHRLFVVHRLDAGRGEACPL